jgi:undecaprenyl-diphosphatase
LYVRIDVRDIFRQASIWKENLDFVVLIAALSVVAGGWSFIELADEVLEGETRAIDEWLLRAVRSRDNPADPIGPVWFEESMRDLTALGSAAVLTLVTATVLGFLLICRKFRILYLVLGSTAGGQILCFALKQFFARPRPSLVTGLTRVQLASFPSGHSMLAAVVYLTLGALLAGLVEPMRLKMYTLTVAMFMAFLVGMSRVYLGVHYPTDVLAGWCAGLSWAVLCWLIARRFR